jgi:hypothetical protein
MSRVDGRACACGLPVSARGPRPRRGRAARRAGRVSTSGRRCAGALPRNGTSGSNGGAWRPAPSPRWRTPCGLQGQAGGEGWARQSRRPARRRLLSAPANRASPNREVDKAACSRTAWASYTGDRGRLDREQDDRRTGREGSEPSGAGRWVREEGWRRGGSPPPLLLRARVIAVTSRSAERNTLADRIDHKLLELESLRCCCVRLNPREQRSR